MKNRICPLILFFFCLPGLTTLVQAFTGTYGINYGRLADNIPPPDKVVKYLKTAKIKNARIFNADQDVLEAFRQSKLELMVGIHNGLLSNMSASVDNAVSWINDNVQPYLNDTLIPGIIVGNEILSAYTGQDQMEALVGSVKNVYNALVKLNLANSIQVFTPHSQAVFNNSYPPSSCKFNSVVLPYMKSILDICRKSGSPLFINIYPFLDYRNDPDSIDINYALFLPNKGVYDSKTNLHYDNMFDAEIDAAYAALEAAGYGDLEVWVSETGWASAGDPDETGATAENARTYNFNLRKRLFKKKGTPRRPKIAVKAYVFALFNEDLKTGKTSEKHFGLLEPNGSIVYDIGLSSLQESHGFSLLSSFKGSVILYTSALLLLGLHFLSEPIR